MKFNRIVCCLMLLSFQAYAHGGDGTGNGGDPVLLRMKLIKAFIHSELRKDASAYFENFDPARISSGPALNALNDMIARDVQSDIQDSDYVLKDSCQGVGGQIAGGAIANDLGGDICLSPKRLAEIDASKAEIVGLVIHEHAHHFGYVDANNGIYQAVYETIALDDPSWSSTDSGSAGSAPAPMPAPEPIKMSFVEIQSGTFQMGSPASEPDRYNNEDLHSVTLTHGFEMQTTDVTQAQYVKVIGSNPSYFVAHDNCPDTYTDTPVAMCPNHPVEQVSWDDTQAFIAKLNSDLHDGYTYRLPTEAEWEYAARAGTQTAYYFGNDASQLGQYAWFSDNSNQQTHDVAKLKPNAFGLYDMAGNVWQWVQDWYDSSYPSGDQTDPIGPAAGSYRVLRGGSWYDDALYLRSAYRGTFTPGYRSGDVGFRLVRTRSE